MKQWDIIDSFCSTNTQYPLYFYRVFFTIYFIFYIIIKFCDYWKKIHQFFTNLKKKVKHQLQPLTFNVIHIWTKMGKVWVELRMVIQAAIPRIDADRLRLMSIKQTHHNRPQKTGWLLILFAVYTVKYSIQSHTKI